MKIFGLSLLLLFHCALLLPGCAAAARQDMAVTGVWSGTLGTSRITACFEKPEPGVGIHGSYYYARHLVPIRLAQHAASDEWTESSGVWAGVSADGGKLQGTWRKSDGGGELPIQLTRIPGTEDHRACGSDAYNAPLETLSMKVEAGPVQSLAQKRYRKISIAGVQLVELIDNAPGIASINRQLRGALHGDAASANFLRSRLRDSIRSYGYYLFNSVTVREALIWTSLGLQALAA
jgi:hypothetical protein